MVRFGGVRSNKHFKFILKCCVHSLVTCVQLGSQQRITCAKVQASQNSKQPQAMCKGKHAQTRSNIGERAGKVLLVCIIKYDVDVKIRRVGIWHLVREKNKEGGY